MIHENEITMLVLGLSVLVLVVLNRHLFSRLPDWRLLLSAFICQLLAWICTVLEEFVWPTPLNLFEHLGYVISALLLTGWCVRVHVYLKEGH